MSCKNGLKRILLLLSVVILTALLYTCSDPTNEEPDYGTPPVPGKCFCDPDGISTYLQWAEETYPGLCRLREIGVSESGQPIYALELSNRPGITEDEPIVLINAAIHGDEQLGAGIALKMIEHLTESYKAGDAEAVSIVNNIKLHFIPALNPDGISASSRYNDNGVDLNRNFGYNWDIDTPYNGNTAFDQGESAAIRSDFSQFGYCLALNLHTASSTANIGIYAPWDAIDTDEPDFITGYLPNYPFIESIGTAYAEMVTGTDIYPFKQYFHYQEGADWYPFCGSMTDWAMGIHGTVSYSIELYGAQNFTTDDSDTLDKCWSAHKDAILDIVKTSALGSGGKVTGNNGLPVSGAEITLTDSGGGSRSFTASPYTALRGSSDSNGLFRLLTAAGTYDIEIRLAGYQIFNAEISISADGKTSIAGGDYQIYPEYQLIE